MNVVQDGRIGEVTVKGQGAWDTLVTHPIDQLLAQGGGVLERDPYHLTKVLLLEAAESEWVVLAGGADVVGDQVVVGDLVTLLGMIPERNCLAHSVRSGRSRKGNWAGGIRVPSR